MAPSVKIKLGNLFDGASDLIVLPCSTVGTITGFVARSLSRYSIPHPSAGMELGQVEILPFEGGENIAQFVAFAVSVKGRASSPSAIEKIGFTLGEFTKKESAVRIISAPLLGAGAGGLLSETVVSALKKGFVNSANENATLFVYVLHQDVFNHLRDNRAREDDKQKKSPRVFVSHTSKTDEAIEWVKNLALFLIDNGIQARLDKFHLRRGMDLHQWMCNELSLAEKVVIVCDETYKLKADGRLGGVGWETMIIQGDIANLPPDSTKYQIIIRTEDIKKGIPLYLSTKYVFHAPPSNKENSFQSELLRELLDLPLDDRIEAKEFSI